MFEITVEKDFAAAHRLNEYNGKCEQLHGHNWHVKLTIGATELDSIGLAIDFREAKKFLARAIEPFDHAYLNELEPFNNSNPSCELIARAIFNAVKADLERLPRASSLFVSKVQVWESAGSSVTYSENNSK